MIRKSVLAYNFTPERLRELRALCLVAQSALKEVPREDLCQTLGCLAGIEGRERVPETYSGEEAAQEMLVMCGFAPADLDKMLRGIRKGKLQNVKLKAMLTPTSSTWTGLELQEALASEHELMHAKKKRS